MWAQKEKGHQVLLMWPGKMNLTGHFVRFKRSKNTQKIGREQVSFESIEVVNPLPVPLDEGILEVDKYMEPCENPEVFEELLRRIQPDAIHIHTFQGLYPELLIAAKELGIKTVFTTHDYFGICPKITLFRDGDVCNGDCGKCFACNKDALSMNKIKMLQSSQYRKFKDSSIVKKLRQNHRDDFYEEDAKLIEEEEDTEKRFEQEDLSDEVYESLRDYYRYFFNFIDVIHFNSTVTRDVYRRYLPNDIKGKVINLSNSSIKDKRKLRGYGGKLRIAYLGPARESKGFFMLKDALDELWAEGVRDFELDVYNETRNVSGYMKVFGAYKSNEMDGVYENADLLVAPSLWYETYGFTVLEALCYGVPPLVTTRVGAKDLLKQGHLGMVIQPTKEDLKQAILYIIKNPSILEVFNKRIYRDFNFRDVRNSFDEVEKLYQ
ncbi:MAG: glycosyltransferase [Eubacterium sp.]|nr:glycosyltransferase [Eubacterium sp.]